MNITVTDQEHCKKQLRLEIPAATVRAETDKLAANLARQVNIPGFRRGHVPTSVVKTRFKKELRDETVSHILPEALQDAITQKDLRVVGEPKIDELKFGDDDSIDVTITVEVAPEFELAEYKGVPLTKRVYKIRDDDVEKTINRLREGLAELRPVEDRGAEDGDIVTANITGTISPLATEQEGEAPEGAEARKPEEINQPDVKIELGARAVLPEFTSELKGTRTGDTRSFTVEYPATFKPEHLAGRHASYNVEVVAVHMKELPEPDDEFAGSVDEGLKSIDELRAKVRSNIEHEVEHRTAAELREAAIGQLIDRNSFELPEQVVDKQIDTRFNSFIRDLSSQGVDPRMLKVDWGQIRDAQRSQAERDVRLSFILDRIAQKEGIEASEDDIDREIEKIAEGMEQPAASLRARLTKEGMLDSIKEQVRSRKALDLVIASADTTIEEVEGPGEKTAGTGNEDGQAEG